MIASSVASLLLTWAAPAQATEGLVWTWEQGEKHRYYLVSELMLPEMLLLASSFNEQVRVTDLTLSLNVLCTAAYPAPKGVELACKAEDVRLVAAPVANDSNVGRLMDILDELDAILLAASIQVVLGEDGRVRSLSLDQVDDRMRRFREREESLRLLVARAFSGLDVHLPKKGNDQGRAWIQSGGAAFGFVSNAGTVGTGRVEHRVVETVGAVVGVKASGSGAFGPGENTPVATAEGDVAEQLRDLFDMTFESVWRFDTAAGILVESDYLVVGTPTPSSQQAEGTQGIPYIQRGKVRLADEKPIPPLPPNSVIEVGGLREEMFKSKAP